ncbi:MAG: class IV adenylate cyclase [Acidobacteria bacterium]|nr:class IV adenylate cyclase [Acidobacteriota bacterium]
MASPNLEVEIKLPVPNLPAIQPLITQLGWRPLTPRTLEINILLDHPDSSLRSRGVILRLRQYGDRSVLTYKGPGQDGKHKVREELETPIGDLPTLQTIFLHLGYHPTFRYEKYRTEFTDGAGHLTLDETPIGTFLELEGAPEWIDAQAAQLGYAESDYITLSYGRLYTDYCRRENRPIGHMVFEGSSPSMD